MINFLGNWLFWFCAFWRNKFKSRWRESQPKEVLPSHLTSSPRTWPGRFWEGKNSQNDFSGLDMKRQICVAPKKRFLEIFEPKHYRSLKLKIATTLEKMETQTSKCRLGRRRRRRPALELSPSTSLNGNCSKISKMGFIPISRKSPLVRHIINVV